MSDIESLTLRVRDLTQNVNFWNTLVLFGLALAAFAAVFIVVATRIVVIRTGQLSATQELLSAAKDRQLQGDLKDKDIEIGNLKLRSDTAEAGIALAHAEAAKANALAEQDKLARVELEDAVAWRRLTEPQISEIGTKLAAFSRQLTAVVYNTGDIEASRFAFDIDTALHNFAKWNVGEPQAVLKMREGPVPFGTNPPLESGVIVYSTKDDRSRAAADALIKELSSRGFDTTLGETINPPNPTVQVFVEPRPEGAQGAAKIRSRPKP